MAGIKKDKREQIIDAALSLFAAEGVAVPTARIAQEAGVANGTLFNYFPSKQGLIDSLYIDIKKEMMALFSDSGVSEAGSMKEISLLVWQSYFDWALANPLKHKVMHLCYAANALSPEALSQSESIFAPLHQMIERGIKKGEIAKIDIDYLYQLIAAQLEVAIAYAHARKLKGAALKEHKLTSFGIHWRGIEA